MEKVSQERRAAILVAHPTRQHSHHLAAALDRAGMLQMYLTMVPTMETFERWPGIGKRLLGSRLEQVDIERSRVLCWMSPWALKRGLDRLIPIGYVSEICAFAVFDLWVASFIPRLRPAILVGYEMACTSSFETAKRNETTCVLDAASFASGLQDRLLVSEKRSAVTPVGRWVRRRKSAEIDLADVIICCSNLAEQSYLETGVPPDRIVINPPGCDVALFSSQVRSSTGAPKFCFVGTAQERKGFEDLLVSFNLHRADSPNSELHIVGDVNAARAFGAAGRSGVTLLGKKNHAELARLLAGMDVLILPSVLDSFGMVVPEALAAGLYVILSDRVGAGMMIADERIGTIVTAGDRAALTLAMTRIAREIARVRNNAGLRRSIACSYDWAHYSERAVQMFEPLIAGEAWAGRAGTMPRHDSDCRVQSELPNGRI